MYFSIRNLVAILVLGFGNVINPLDTLAAAGSCTIAWSHYTGWEPIQYMKDSGILANWAKKYNVELDITPPMDYIESINQYTAKQFCAVAITNMDALTIPAVGGIDTTFVVLGDYSNGNDGILLKSTTPATINGIVGHEVKLVENTVSHYLLARALQINNLKLTNVKTANASDSDIGAIFAAGLEGTVVVTWNPILMTATRVKGAQLLFDSSKIPGEIIDGIAVHSTTSDSIKKALVGAWFEVAGIMSEEGTSRRRTAISQMARSAGGNETDFLAQLRTTYLFSKPGDAAKFAKDGQLKKTMDFIRKFIFDVGLFKSARSPDTIGIQFPDGTVLGDPKNVRLRFDAKYMDMAAEGAL
jgi:NitT/TauT family transport system substrate-binding protein